MAIPSQAVMKLRAFHTLMVAQIKLIEFISRSTEAFGYYDGVRFERRGNRLEIVEVDPAARRYHWFPSTQEPIQSMAKDPLASSAKDNSLTRMLELLDLFTPAAPYWSADSLIRYTGASRATIYRHVRALHEAGFIRPVADGNYIIGPRIIELDRQLRQTDPLYIAGDGIMKQLAETTRCSALLCALFSDSVMCVREELAEKSPPNLLSRGQKRPLFTGAASKIMLPYLPPHQMRGVYAKHKKAIATSGLGSDWTAFRDALAQMRKAGYVSTVGEFNAGVLGLSAPVFNRSGQILGSLGIADAESRFKKADMTALAATVVAAADAVTARIGVLDSVLDFPPRAIG